MTTATVAAVYDRRYSIDHARSRRSSSRSYPLVALAFRGGPLQQATSAVLRHPQCYWAAWYAAVKES